MMIGLAALDPNNPAANITTDPNAGAFLRAYCDSILGQTLSPAYCGIPSVNQTAAYVAAEQAGTSMTPENQAAAIAAANAAITADQQQNPAGYIAQAAASNDPTLSSIFGPSTVGSALGYQPDGTQSLFGGWGIYALAAIGVVVFMGLRR